MKVAFICAAKDREFDLAKAFLAGVEAEGDEAELIYKTKGIDFSVADAFCVVGVKSLKLVREIRAAGKHVIYFDKGYLRHRGPSRTWEYWRIAINDHHPTNYVTHAKHSYKRWEAVSKQRAIRLPDWRPPNDGHIIFAGSSEKYHAFVELKEPTRYASKVIEHLRRLTKRRIIYRPKPTWMEATEIPGAVFSPRTQSITDVLIGAWCLVTNGSNSAFDACLAGVPSIVLGQGIARPISSTVLEDIESPRLATTDERRQWLSNLAWCQFTEAEMTTGLAWRAVRPQLTGGTFDDSTEEVAAVAGVRAKKADLKKMGLWYREGRAKLSKEEQRRTKPFKKVKLADYWKAKESES